MAEHHFIRQARPVIIETERLIIREMGLSDFPFLRSILKDSETMKYHEGALNVSESFYWYYRQRIRYFRYGFGLWAVTLKPSGYMLGQCGITFQRVQNQSVPALGYLFNREYWGNGYAKEAVSVCVSYALNILNFEEVYALINSDNKASIRVAEGCGLTLKDVFIRPNKHFNSPFSCMTNVYSLCNADSSCAATSLSYK